MSNYYCATLHHRSCWFFAIHVLCVWRAHDGAADSLCCWTKTVIALSKLEMGEWLPSWFTLLSVFPNNLFYSSGARTMTRRDMGAWVLSTGFITRRRHRDKWTEKRIREGCLLFRCVEWKLSRAHRQQRKTRRLKYWRKASEKIRFYEKRLESQCRKQKLYNQTKAVEKAAARRDIDYC